MRKKWTLLLLSVVMLMSLFLSACGSTDNNKASNNEGQTQGDSQKSITLRFSWWGGDQRHEATLKALERYMELNDHVTIEAEYGGFDGYEQKLKTQLAGKTAPDLIQVDQPWLYDLATHGDMFLDLYTMSDYIDLSTFDEDFLKDYTEINGQLQGLPTGSNGMIITYNKDFFEKYSIPHDIQFNWDNLLEIGKQVYTESNGQDILLNVDPAQLTLMLKLYVRQQTGNQFIEDDFTLGFEEAHVADALEYIKQYFENGVVQSFAESAPYHNKIEEHPKWHNGEFGMIMNYPSTVPVLKEGVPFEVGVISSIIDPDAATTAIVVRPSQVFSIAENTNHPEETAKLLNWLLNDEEAVQILGDVRGTPASAKALEVLEETGKIDPLVKEGTEIAFATSGGPQNGITNNAEIEKIIADIIEKLAYDRTTPTEAAKEMVQSLTSKLAEIKG